MRQPGQGRKLPPKDAPKLRRVAGEVAYVVDFIWRHPANRGKRLRTLASATAFQVRGRVLGKPSIARVGDRSRLWAHLHVASSSKAMYASIPDYAEMQIWRRHLKDGDLFVDIGANVGIYTLLAAERGCEVIAIEPDARSIERLNQNIALNGYDVRVVRAAVGAEPGTLTVTTDLDMGNHVVLAGTDAGRTVQVPAVTLDDVLGDRVAAGVKVDVEGGESLVLAGAERALGEQRIRLMQIEWNFCSESLMGVGRDDIAQTLRSHGYEFFRPDAEGRPVPVEDPEPGITDVFARPRG
jgi:FkbM family methyltransferase